MAKKAHKKKRKFRFFAAFLVVFTLVMAVKCAGQLLEIHSLADQKSELEANYAQIMAERERLEEKKELLNNETYLKRLARENLLMIREGEYLIMPFEQNDEVVEYDESSSPDDEDIH